VLHKVGFDDGDQKKAAGRSAAAMSGLPDAGGKNAGIKGRPKSERETKKRVSLALLPSLYEDIQKIAYVERKSASEIVAQCLEQYTKKNGDKLKRYELIKSRKSQ